MDDNEDVVSVQSANVIDLSAYRAQRKALAAAANSAPTWDQYQPLPFHGQTFFFGPEVFHHFYNFHVDLPFQLLQGSAWFAAGIGGHPLQACEKITLWPRPRP